MRAVNIQWVTDGYEVDLPEEMEIPDKYIDENGDIDYDAVSDYLSDTTGYLHDGFDVENDYSLIDDDYIKEVNAAYWEEESEFESDNHPSQILERVKEALDFECPDSDIYMNYNGFDGTRVGVYIKDEFYGIFDYEENVFQSTPETRLIDSIEYNDMGPRNYNEEMEM